MKLKAPSHLFMGSQHDEVMNDIAVLTATISDFVEMDADMNADCDSTIPEVDEHRRRMNRLRASLRKAACSLTSLNLYELEEHVNDLQH